MLDRTHTLPDGTNLVVEGDVHDIARRLHEGDPTLGWAGDPNLLLFLNVATGMFEVWAPDAHLEPYLAVAHPRCDASLIRRLVDADNRRETAYDRVVAANAKAEADAAQVRADHQEEVADRLHHALRKDLGHHVGGSTRRHL
jgi:hypothetical protein